MMQGSIGLWRTVALIVMAVAPAVAQEAPEERVRWSPWEGIRYRDPATGVSAHVGGIIALDTIDYGSHTLRDSGTHVDRAVVVGDLASAEDDPLWKVHLEADLRGVETEYGFDEAWGTLRIAEHARLTAGLLEIPLGAEDAINEEDLAFTNYSFPAYLGHKTDLALRLDGEMGDGVFSYDLTAAAGQGFDRFGQKRDGPQGSAKFTVRPFQPDVLDRGIPVLSGAFIGGGIAYTRDFEGELDVANPVDVKLFHLPEMKADEARFHQFHMGTDAGSVRFLLDVVRGSLIDLETPAGTESLKNQITAWEAQTSVLITGEEYDSRPYRLRDGRPQPFPARPLGGGGAGAVELAFRYANADIDRQFFVLGLADYRASSQEFRSITTALNWYPVAAIRFTGEMVRTIADQTPGDLEGENRDTSWVFRVQYRF